MSLHTVFPSLPTIGEQLRAAKAAAREARTAAQATGWRCPEATEAWERAIDRLVELRSIVDVNRSYE